MCRVHEEVQCTADVVGRRWLYAQKCGQVRYRSSCQNSSQYTCVTDSKEYLYHTLVYSPIVHFLGCGPTRPLSAARMN